MRQLVLGSIIVILAGILTPSAFACSCAPPRPGITESEIIKARLQVAKAVFVGTVTASHRKTSFLGKVFSPVLAAILGEGGFDHVATFRVDVSVKLPGSNQVRVATGHFGHGLCGFVFEKGKSYLVYAYGDRELETNICSRTREFDNVAREELKVLLN